MPKTISGQQWCNYIKVTLKNKGCTGEDIGTILSEEQLYQDYLDSDALVALAQQKELTIEHVKKLARCKNVTELSVNDQFYKNLNKNKNISDLIGVDKVIVVGLAKHLTDDQQQLDKILTAAIGATFDGLNDVLDAFWQNKNITDPKLWFNPIDSIFEKIKDKGDQLTEKNLTYLAKYAKTADHFTFILISLLSTKRISPLNQEAIIRNVLKNKNFDINKITDSNQLLLLLPYCDAKQCKNMIDVIRHDSLWDKLTKEALINLAKYVDSSRDIEALFKAKEIDYEIINTIIANASGNRLGVLVKAVRDKDLWKQLPDASLAKLVMQVDSADDFKNILAANHCNMEVVNAIITRAVNLGKKARLSRRYSLLGSVVDDVFSLKPPTFDIKELTDQNLQNLNECLTSLAPQHAEKKKFLMDEINRRGVAGLNAETKEEKISPKEKPALEGHTTESLGFNPPQKDIRLTEWQQRFQANTELNQHLALGNPDNHRCVFKKKEVSLFGEPEAKAFIDAIMLMAENSDKKPLTIQTYNFDQEFIKKIMDTLDAMKSRGQKVPDVELQFDNFVTLSAELKTRVQVYNKSSPNTLPLVEEDKTDPKLLLKIAEKMDLMERKLEGGMGAIVARLAVLEDLALSPPEEETNELIPFLLQNWDEDSETGYIKNILSFSPDVYSDVTKDDPKVQEFCTMLYNYFLANQGQDCKIISLNVNEDTLQNIQGILAIASALAEIKNAHPELKMQIEFKNAEGQPINENNFITVGMTRQWADFQEKITKIREQLPDASPAPPVPGGPNHLGSPS